MHIQRHTAEAAHSVYNQLFVVELHNVGNLFERIQDTGRGFAMYYGYMGDI